MLCNICGFDNIPMYSTGENCVFILKIFNKETADEYDDIFMSGCNSIVCLNRALIRQLNRRLNVGRTSQWYILMALRILQYANSPS